MQHECVNNVLPLRYLRMRLEEEAMPLILDYSKPALQHSRH